MSTVIEDRQANLRAKIEYAREIAERGATEDERDAAERALAGMLKRLEDMKGEPPAWTWEPRYKGTKYEQTARLGNIEVAALIRADIRFARKIAKMTPKPGDVAVADPIGRAPAQIKVSVRVWHYMSIAVTASNIPDDWGYERAEDIYRQERLMPTVALVEFGAALRDIADAYNFDDSDPMVDHFHTRYYLTVKDTDGNGIDQHYGRRYRPAA